MTATQRFSGRHGLVPDAEISVRNDAPPALRSLVVDAAYEAGLRPSNLREFVCACLLEPPNPGNWSEYPNVDGEVRDHLYGCEWYFVYDIVEIVSEALDDENGELSRPASTRCFAGRESAGSFSTVESSIAAAAASTRSCMLHPIALKRLVWTPARVSSVRLWPTCRAGRFRTSPARFSTHMPQWNASCAARVETTHRRSAPSSNVTLAACLRL